MAHCSRVTSPTSSSSDAPPRSRARAQGPDQGVIIKLLSVLLLAVAGALIFAVVRMRDLAQMAGGQAATAPRLVMPAAELGADEKATIGVFREVSGSVVNITSIEVRRNRFSMDVSEIPQGTGSGFLWDTAGHVVTNFHVVAAGDRAQVTLQDGTTYAAKLVGRAPDKDLAVLKIDAPPSKLRPIPIGASAGLIVGQKVLAIGNPFGFDQTLTAGVISGLGREIKSMTQRPITDVIQTDAPINPGNSGGPLLDSAGRLIGINTAIYSPTGSSAGIGFAVPVDTVNQIVAQLIKHGRVVRPGLGIKPASDAQSKHLGIAGVMVINVDPNGAAGKAGLVGVSQDDTRWVVGDVIVKLDSHDIKSTNDLYKALDQYKPGDDVVLGVTRGGQRRDVTVTLQALP